METTNNGTQDTEARPRTLQERALAEYAEVAASIREQAQEQAQQQRARDLARFARVLCSPNFGEMNAVPTDTTVILDGVTLRYHYRYDGYIGDDVVKMAVPCRTCNTGQAWVEVNGLYDIGRVLHGERWGGIGAEQCSECQSATEEAREAATTDSPAYMQPAPTATDRLVHALVDVLREHGYSITRTGEDY